MRKLLKISFLLGTVFFFGQCAKEIEVQPTSPPKTDVVSSNLTGLPTIVVIPTPPYYPSSSVNSFDWESIDFMPAPTPTAPTWFQPLVPWGGGACLGYPLDLRWDYSKNQGWELLYNSFTDQNIPDMPYFILYNKYRGLVRLYWLMPKNITAANIGVLAHKIALKGSYSALSPLLNFADQTIIDPQKKSAFASIVENTIYPGALCPTWQALQFEVAYDPNVYTQNQSTLNFEWGITSLIGILPKGSLQQEGTDFLSNPSLTGTSQLLVRGSIEAVSLQNQNVISKGVLASIERSFKNFEIDSASFNNYNLTSLGNNCSVVGLNVSYNYAWTVNNAFLTGIGNMALPGYDQTHTQNLKPNYNEALGVFNLTDRPRINFTKTKDDHPFTYSLDISSVKYAFNPTVSDIADIQNINQTMIASAANTPSPQIIYSGQQLKSNQSLNVIGVRVSFDVVPKNGSPKYTIVKMFKANVQ